MKKIFLLLGVIAAGLAAAALLAFRPSPTTPKAFTEQPPAAAPSVADLPSAPSLSQPPAKPDEIPAQPPAAKPTPAPKPVEPPKTETKPAPAVPAAAAPGVCHIPDGAGPESAKPTTVVGDGTAASCASDKVVEAVHKGGLVAFDCGPDPLTIKVPEIKIFNNGGKGDGSVTIDGGGKITLAAAGQNRIFYQNTCDQSLVWTSPRCDIQSTPHLALQNITLAGGRGEAGEGSLHDALGGGAVYVRGGTFKAYNLKVIGSQAVAKSGTSTQDVAGGAIYAFGLAKPATIVESVFQGDSAANGGAIGGLFVSYSIVNSKFIGNKATGRGMNPAKPGTPGGGLGGAIYSDGNSYSLNICGSEFTDNDAPELGSGSLFMVANDLKGKLAIDRSVFSGNGNAGSVQKLPSIYVEAQDKRGIAGVTVSGTKGL